MQDLPALKFDNGTRASSAAEALYIFTEQNISPATRFRRGKFIVEFFKGEKNEKVIFFVVAAGYNRQCVGGG